MTSKLDRRVEVTFPVYDAGLQRELKALLEIQWQDNVKARILSAELTNQYRPRKGKAVRAQMAFYDYLRARAEAAPEEQASA